MAISILSSTETEAPAVAKKPVASKNQSAVVRDIIRIIEKEYHSGNRTVTNEKYEAFLKLQSLHAGPEPHHETSPPPLPAPLYPPIFQKFKPPQKPAPVDKPRPRRSSEWTFKRVETTVIAILETLANILDNLHLLSMVPVFPKSLTRLLSHTNRIWVLILIFLIRKTVSQLLNVRRKERKVANELAILKCNSNSKLLEQDSSAGDSNIFRKYDRVLRNLKFDKMMLKFELLGNLLDLSFNAIELYHVAVPQWIMSTLNLASMAMTIYRMNKDDEYLDDDITDDMI